MQGNLFPVFDAAVTKTDYNTVFCTFGEDTMAAWNIGRRRMKKQKKNIQEIIKLQSEINELNYGSIYDATIEKVTNRIKEVQDSLDTGMERKVINTVSSRMKSAESINKKLRKKAMPSSFIAARAQFCDIIGVRIVVMYLDDAYKVARLLKKSTDITFLYEKDYIKHPKKSGYRSIHLIFSVPIEVDGKTYTEKCEIQIRTMEMDCWASLEHQMIYKSKPVSEEIHKEIIAWAKEMARMDNQLMLLRKRIDAEAC